jgi:hypothetical protein
MLWTILGGLQAEKEPSFAVSPQKIPISSQH